MKNKEEVWGECITHMVLYHKMIINNNKRDETKTGNSTVLAQDLEKIVVLQK